MGRSRWGVAVVVALCALSGGTPARAQEDTAKADERGAEHQQAAYAAELRTKYASNAAAATQVQATDPERLFVTDVCWHGAVACAGDIRLYGFQERGRGLAAPTLWTARNGSTISGHVWMTKHGPAKRPGIVITNGSIQAPEELYWWAAQSLARAGYVVVTFDPQMQGKSDTFGAGADAGDGVPSQTAGNTFFDHTQDAIDFLLSSPAAPFCARPSRSGTSHCAKQDRRVGEGRNAPFNPFWSFVDPDRIGIAGHSYGASGVSWVGQQDPRVDAVVAWDNMCDPAPGSADACSRGGQGDPPGRRVPTLGMSGDSFLGSSPSGERDDKLGASAAFSKAGVDTGSITIRGGTHFEWSYLPSTTFKATLRGIDLAAWYTTAWFDKYVKRDPSADLRLLSDRWHQDPGDRRVDPAGGGNLLSRAFRSRLDVRLADGARFTCEDLREGCGGMTPAAQDGGPAEYSVQAVATAKDGEVPPGVTTEPRALPGVQVGGSCRSRRSITLTVSRPRGVRVTRVQAFVDGRRVGQGTGRRVRVDLSGRPKGAVRVVLRVTGRRAGRTVTSRQVRRFRTCTPRRG